MFRHTLLSAQCHVHSRQTSVRGKDPSEANTCPMLTPVTAARALILLGCAPSCSCWWQFIPAYSACCIHSCMLHSSSCDCVPCEQANANPASSPASCVSMPLNDMLHCHLDSCCRHSFAHGNCCESQACLEACASSLHSRPLLPPLIAISMRHTLT